MKKVIILSVHPQWLIKILTGKKNIEIRKSMPKCELPIDVYLYCTKENTNLFKVFREVYMYFDMGVAEPFEYFKYYKLGGYDYSGKGKARFEIENGFYDELYYKLNGKIVAKFTLNKVDEILPFKKQKRDKVYITYLSHCGDVNWGNKTCLDQVDFENYLGLKTGYGWYIDNLEIFKKPMELSEFYRNNYQVIQDYESCNNYDCIYAVHNSILGDDVYCPFDECPKLRISKAPISWCYAYTNL